MKNGLQIGDQFEFSIVVTPVMQAQFEEIEVHPLYSTASMLTHMEWAARQHILPYLEHGEEGVGYQMDIKHLNPTPIGDTVRIQSTVTEVLYPFDGFAGKVTSTVQVWNSLTLAGEGKIVQGITLIHQLESRYPGLQLTQNNLYGIEALTPLEKTWAQKLWQLFQQVHPNRPEKGIKALIERARKESLQTGQPLQLCLENMYESAKERTLNRIALLKQCTFITPYSPP